MKNFRLDIGKRKVRNQPMFWNWIYDLFEREGVCVMVSKCNMETGKLGVMALFLIQDQDSPWYSC